MTALVVIAALMAVGSGGLKMFGKGGRASGFSIWALFEVVAGGIVPFYVFSIESTPGVLGLILFLMLGLIFFSSFQQISRTRARRRHREATEAARLDVWVKYLSREIDEETIQTAPKPQDTPEADEGSGEGRDPAPPPFPPGADAP